MSALVVHLPVLDAAAPLEIQRPRTRGDCVDGPRPCPWVSCEHHLLLGVLTTHSNGSLTEDDAVAALETMPETCALDVADRAGATLEDVGLVFGVSRERIRQIEAKALKAIKRAAEPLRDDIAEEPMVELRPARVGAARPIEDRRRTEAPAQHAGLATPETVQSAAEGMWCPWMGAAMTGGLCARRHAARVQGGVARGGNPSTAWPTYPGCASCADGAAVAARLGAVGELVPVREAVPARAIDWMGEGESPGDDAPAEGATEDDVKTAKTETVAKAVAKSSGPSAGCAIHGCDEAPTKVRANTPRGTEGLCPAHRRAVRKLTRERGLDVASAVARVQALARAGVGSQAGPDAVRRALAAAGLASEPTKPSQRAEAPATQPSAELALVRQDRDELRAQHEDDQRVIAALRAELAAARAAAPVVASPWARLDRLAQVLRPGAGVTWIVAAVESGGWEASGHEAAGAMLWSGEGATPDEAIAALVAVVEGEATARVQAIRAALEGRP